MKVIDGLCKTLGISEKVLFPERYMNDEEKQEYIEGYIKFIKNIFKKGEHSYELKEPQSKDRI